MAKIRVPVGRETGNIGIFFLGPYITPVTLIVSFDSWDMSYIYIIHAAITLDYYSAGFATWEKESKIEKLEV